MSKVSYSGVFKLEKQVISGGRRDTLMDLSKMKIYTDHYYIYGGIGPDTTVHIGLGTYALDSSSTIVEHNIFNNRALDSTQIFVVKITSSAKGRTQVVPDFGRYKGTQYILTENYTQLPATGTSALDSVWELDTIYMLKGRDTMRQKETRFKLFWSGHFMTIRRYPVKDISNSYKNGFSYGTFILKGNDLMEDQIMASDAKPDDSRFTAKVSLAGNDKYRQVAIDPKSGIETMEIYKRIRQGSY
ncbi:MAG TPA: hypothetical protein VGM63_13625 [Mucilaginibacter sp.]